MNLKTLFFLSIIICCFLSCNSNAIVNQQENIKIEANISQTKESLKEADFKIDSSVLFNLNKMLNTDNRIFLIAEDDWIAWKSKKVKYCEIDQNLKVVTKKNNNYFFEEKLLSIKNQNDILILMLENDEFKLLDNKIIYKNKSYLFFDDNLDIVGNYIMKPANGKIINISFEKNYIITGYIPYKFFKFYNKNESTPSCEALSENDLPWVIKFTAAPLKKDLNTYDFDSNESLKNYDNIRDSKEPIYLVEYDGKSTYKLYNIANEAIVREEGYSEVFIMDVGCFTVSHKVEKGNLAFELIRQ